MSSCLTNPSLSGDNSVDPNDEGDDTDTIDAEVFEIFNGELQVDHSAAPIPIPDSESMPPVSVQPTIQLDADDSDADDSDADDSDADNSDADNSDTHDSETASVFIDRFPFGNPGAPISGPSGTCQGSPIDDTGCAALGDLIWAPFDSKHDWDIACWAKRHSLTSSAITELLAIPEVRKHTLICYFPTNA
jgi:hypothetical protein